MAAAHKFASFIKKVKKEEVQVCVYVCMCIRCGEVAALEMCTGAVDACLVIQRLQVRARVPAVSQRARPALHLMCMECARATLGRVRT